MADQLVADVAAETATEEAAPPRGGRRRLLLIALVVLLVGAAAGWFLLGSGDTADATESEPVAGEVVEVAQMTASTGGDTPGYVRLSFAAVLREGVVAEAVSDRFALLKDAALSTVSEQSASKLRSPDGLDRVRKQLTKAAKQVYPDGEVLRIVLTELLVQ